MKKKLKKKGFTLTELIGVLVVLGIIMSIALSMVIGIRSNILEQDYHNIVSLLEIEAANYAEDTGITTVTVENLIQNGYVMPDDETDIYNPVDNESLNCHLITSVYDNGSYVSTFGEDIGRDENGTCNPYESTVDLVICQYDENFEECNTIESKDADGNDKWLGENVNLGVMYRNGDILKDETISYYWTSTDGNSGNNYTIATNTTLINQSIYTVRVTFADSTVNETSQAINIDLQAPAIVEVSLENIDDTPTNSEWSRGKNAKITASDYSGSGVAGIYAGNATTCTKDLDYVKVDATNSAKIKLAENLNTICVIDNAGNASNSEYKVENDKVDVSGPSISNLVASPTSYTRSVTLTGTAQDTKSGLVAYKFTTSSAYSDSGWTNVTKTNDVITRTYNVTSNGTYYFWTKDEIGNYSSKSIVIRNIDVVSPTGRLSLNTSQTNYVSGQSTYAHSAVLTARMNDVADSYGVASGIDAYEIVSPSGRSTGWVTSVNTSGTNSLTINYSATDNGTYTLRVRDNVGNISSSTFNLNILVVSRTTSVYGKEYDNYYSDSVYVNGLKLLSNVTTNNGSVISRSNSGTRVSFTVSGGRSTSETFTDTCQTSESRYSAYVDYVCTRYTCPYGGDLSGSRCVGRTYNFTGYLNVRCTQYGWSSYGGSNRNCDLGYTKSFYCDHNDGDPCSPVGSTGKKTCYATCRWQGNYSATCSGEREEYSCDRGDRLSGRYCYTCSRGSYNDWTGYCEYSCPGIRYYWAYTVMISYYALK